MINGLENDTIYYEDTGYFTSVGPLGVNIFGELTAHPGDGIALDFNVENNGTEQIAPDISISFEAESMNCLSSISEDIFNMGDISACLLYTSDAADEGLGVDLGGRRIIKK